MEDSLVPSKFPFVYFSDNAAMVYLYQIPVFTFQARSHDSLDGIDSSGYFAFNAMDRRMEFHKVNNLNKAANEMEKLIAVMDGKMILRAGFVYQGQVYLVTKDAVYVVDQQAMQKDPMPNHTRVALRDFLRCDKKAIRKCASFVAFTALTSPSTP
mgnify:CR=1 FL=1